MSQTASTVIRKFSTWKALYEAMLEDMADDGWRKMQSYQVAGRVINYRSFEGYLNLLKYVEQKKDLEEGKTSYKGRMYAGQKGRG